MATLDHEMEVTMRWSMILCAGAGLAVGFGANYGLRAHDYWQGYDAGRAAVHYEFDKMKQMGLCEWPKRFYAVVNCGSIAPDYHQAD